VINPNWTIILTNYALRAPSSTLWVKVLDYVQGPRTLRIQATGPWSYGGPATCGPDGDPALGFEHGNLHSNALRGCLLAKIGGSGGDTPGEAKIQAVGSDCVFDIPENVSGALFLTMNDHPKRFHLHSGRVIVTISDAPAPA